MVGAAVVAAACIVASGLSAHGKGEVIIATFGGSFGDAQRAAYFEPFEKETGIKVTVAAVRIWPSSGR